MNKNLKFVLQVALVFFASLILLFIMKLFGIIDFVWPGAIGTAMGYAFVLKKSNKKSNDNK